MQSVNLLNDARYTDERPTVLHAVKTDQLLVDGVYLKPGQTTGWHKHPDADRAFLCVQGSGEVVLETIAAGNELRVPLGPGAVVLVPRDVFHDLIAGPQGMVCSALSKFPVRMVEKG